MCFNKIGSCLNEKVLDKKAYSNKETLKVINNCKNDLFTIRKDKIKKYIFANNFKYVKGKILLYYINIMIIMILNLPIKTTYYMELKIPGPRTSKVFYENKGSFHNDACQDTTLPINVYIKIISGKTA